MTEDSVYEYQLTAVDRSTDLLRSQLPAGSELLYSIKANPHPGIIRRAAQLGLSLETSSWANSTSPSRTALRDVTSSARARGRPSTTWRRRQGAVPRSRLSPRSSSIASRGSGSGHVTSCYESTPVTRQAMQVFR